MAKETTNLTDSSPRDCFGNGVKTKIALALTVALVSPVISASSQKCEAADFRHAKKLVVPATSIPRRYDYGTSGGREAGIPAGYESSYSDPTSHNAAYPSSTSTAIPYSSSPSKAGLVPPPPPVSPGLLPSSMAGDVPPPPSAPSMVSRSATTGSAAATTVSSSGYQTTSGDPTRPTGADRHAGNTKAYKLGAENSTVAHVVAHADQLVKDGKLQEAQEVLEKYDKVYPKNAAIDSKLSQVSLDRAKYYVRHDDYVEGAKQARIAIAHNSSNTEAKHVLEQVLRHHGIEPTHAASRVKLGDVLFSQGKLKEARVEYDAALKSDHATGAYIGLGNISLRENRLKDAKAHYQLALDKDPESAVALRQLGIVRYKQKDVVGANTDLSRALILNQDDKLAGQTLVELWQRQVSLHPRDANSHLGLARAYQLSGDLKSAQGSYRTVVSIEPNHPNLPAARQSFKLALARQEAQKTYEAAKTLDASGAVPEAYNKAAESVSLSPGDVKFRLYQAELAERLGNAPEAKHLYMEILRQDPKNLVAAQKVKTLTEHLAGSEASQSLRGPIGAMQGDLQPQSGALDSAAGALAQGASTGSLYSNLGTPRLRGVEGPALATLPGAPGMPGNTRIPSADPIQNMSGFLGQLRNHMLLQKKELQQQEDTVLDALHGKTKSSSKVSAAALDELPPDPSLPALPDKLIGSADVQKLLASTGTKPSVAGTAAGAAAGAAASALSSRGATSASDIHRLLSGGSTTGGAPELSSSLPPLDTSGGLSSALRSAPPLSSGSAPSSLEQFTSQKAVNNSLLSAPTRSSESVLKVADTPEVMPPVAPSRYGSPASAQSLSAPQAAYSNPGGFSAMPQAGGIDMNALAAQAQQLSPQAMSSIARSLGMDPATMQSMASQAMQQAPQLMSQAPGLINKQLANLKQEDIDKYSKMFKDHVAKQQAKFGTSPSATTKDVVTTKATPELMKKVEMAKADPKSTAVTAAKGAAAKTNAKTGSKVTAKPAATKVADKTAIASKTTSATATPTSSSSSIAASSPTASSAVSEPPTFTMPPVGDAPAAALGAGSSEAGSVAAESLGTSSTATATAATAAATAVTAAATQSTETSATSATGTSAPGAETSSPDTMSYLAAQNKDLSSQLEDTKKELQMLRESMFNSSLATAKKMKTPKTETAKAPKAEKVKHAKEPKSQQASSGSSASGNVPSSSTLPPTGLAPTEAPGGFTPSGFNPTGGFNPANGAPNMASSALGSIPNVASIPQFSPDASPIVNLELAGVNVKPKGVRLNVVLKNGTGQPLEIPASTKAVVRMIGMPDQLAEVKFPVKSVTAGQEARGYISVSGHRLDPSADVFIPKLVSTANGTRDVHLTVPISALTGQQAH